MSAGPNAYFFSADVITLLSGVYFINSPDFTYKEENRTHLLVQKNIAINVLEAFAAVVKHYLRSEVEMY